MKQQLKRGDLDCINLSPLSLSRMKTKAPTGRRTQKLMLAILTIVFLGVPGLATAQHKAQVSEIDAYVAKVNRFIQLNRKSSRVFGNLSSVNETVVKWREFRNEDEMEKARTDDNLNEISFVWTREDKIAGANFTFSSPSGDWAHMIAYYFRDDGSLAKVDAQLNTFYGDLSVLRTLYFNKGGALIKNTRKYLDLKTRKPTKPGKPGEFFDHSIPMYRHVRALPFHKLL